MTMTMADVPADDGVMGARADRPKRRVFTQEYKARILAEYDAAKRTIPVALLSFQGEFLTDYPLLFTGVVVASAPIVIAYVFLQRYFVAGITAGAVKG